MSEQPMRWGDHPETRAAMDEAFRRRAASAPDGGLRERWRAWRDMSDHEGAFMSWERELFDAIDAALAAEASADTEGT